MMETLHVTLRGGLGALQGAVRPFPGEGHAVGVRGPQPLDHCVVRPLGRTGGEEGSDMRAGGRDNDAGGGSASLGNSPLDGGVGWVRVPFPTTYV